MLIPKYWAEARLQYKTPTGQKPKWQITLRRFGWSETSQEEAQQHAEQRVQMAMDEVLQSKVEAADVIRREPKVGYSGADGLPIREEIVVRQDDYVITRNSYGALCLNTPDVMFLDVDVVEKFNYFLILSFFTSFFMTNILIARMLNNSSFGYLVSVILGLLVGGCVVYFHKKISKKIKQVRQSTPEKHAQARIDAFAAQNPDWVFNLYRTFAGFRLLVLHCTFDPTDKALWKKLAITDPDPLYAQMCRLQNCFRARLTPKPWRTNIMEHIKPRQSWDIAFALDPIRIKWIALYEQKSNSYAACSFIKRYGEGVMDAKAERILKVHDDWCKAHSSLPLA